MLENTNPMTQHDTQNTLINKYINKYEVLNKTQTFHQTRIHKMLYKLTYAPMDVKIAPSAAHSNQEMKTAKMKLLGRISGPDL
jgi:hypothetical protein